MSTVRFFDVPHVFRYGQTDDEKCESWALFWRNATCFSVDIKQADIAGTSFEKKWSPCIEQGGKPADHYKRWEDLCDCTIEQILPTLQQLAPIDGHQWITLEDYLTTPKYELRLFKDDENNDVVAKVMSGPIQTPAFEIEPQSFSELEIPRDFPHISASDIVVLDHDKDLRHPPHKVRISKTGEVVSLIRAERSTTFIHTDGTRDAPKNNSLKSMAAMLKLHGFDRPLNISRPLAIVTTIFSDPRKSTAATEGEPNLKIAGLLHTSVPESARVLEDKDCIKFASVHAAEWKAELTTLLETLHSHGVVHGNVNPMTILIDHSMFESGNGEGSVWLKPPSWTANHFFIDAANAGTEAADWQGLNNSFDGWLDFELRKAQGVLEAHEGETWIRPDRKK